MSLRGFGNSAAFSPVGTCFLKTLRRPPRTGGLISKIVKQEGVWVLKAQGGEQGKVPELVTGRANPCRMGSVPSMREIIISTFLQLLLCLPWPVKWYLPGSALSLSMGWWQGWGQWDNFSRAPRSLLLIFIPIFVAFLSSSLSSLNEVKSPDPILESFHSFILSILPLF